MNLDAVVNLDIRAFSGTTITELEAGIYNGMVDSSKGVPVVTQRPSLDLLENADSVGNRGRAIYFWDENNQLYILNNDTIYKGTYSTALGTTITAGTQKCKFLQLGTSLILLDQEDDAGYIIATGDTVTAIASPFPVTLSHGGAILNGYLYVMDEAGKIYNSNLDAPATFTSGDNIDAEREEDGGIYLGKHHDHVFALNERTLEFFYDNANPTNSPLSRREDVAYNFGCADGKSVWEDGDFAVFVGTDKTGGIGVFSLERFALKRISTGSIDSFLSQGLARDNLEAVGSGFVAQGHRFYILTIYSVSTDINPGITLIYDFIAGLWYEWVTTLGGNSNFPIIDWSLRAGQNIRFGEGIMSDGDVVQINNDFTPQDTVASSIYVTPATYVEADYITDSGATGTALTMRIRLGQYDGGSNTNKFMYNLRPRMNKTTDSSTMTIRFAEDNNDTFTDVGTFDTRHQYNNIRRCGRFNRRNIELEFSGSEQIWIESVEASIKPGTL